MRERERRSLALPQPQARKRWTRPEAPRPTAPVHVPLPSADPMVPHLDEPEPLQPVDVFGLLPHAVRLDLQARLREVAR